MKKKTIFNRGSALIFTTIGKEFVFLNITYSREELKKQMISLAEEYEKKIKEIKKSKWITGVKTNEQNLDDTLEKLEETIKQTEFSANTYRDARTFYSKLYFEQKQLLERYRRLYNSLKELKDG